jgi:ketosteroid isomerase-like protein
MRSEEALKALARVDRELIESRVELILGLRKANRLREMMDYIAEDIVYNVSGNWMALPFVGQVKGKANMARALVSIATQFENLGSEIHDLLIEGERVALRRTSRVRHRGTNRVADVAIVDFLRFRDGLVIELSEVTDSLKLTQLEDF